MGLTNWITSMRTNDGGAFAAWQQGRIKALLYALLIAGVFLFPEVRAQSVNLDGLCSFASLLKQVATGAAIIALILFVINSMFMKSSVFGDIILYVIIGAVIVAVAPEVISMTGLTADCSNYGN